MSKKQHADNEVPIKQLEKACRTAHDERTFNERQTSTNQTDNMRTCSTSSSNTSEESVDASNSSSGRASSGTSSTTDQSTQLSKVDTESSSVQFTSAQLEEFAKGTNRRDVEGNENFDSRFYRNQIAVYQHDSGQRPSSSAEAEARVELDPVDVHVLAKRIAQPKDLACWISVRQLEHLGSGTFSDVYLGVVSPARAPLSFGTSQHNGDTSTAFDNNYDSDSTKPVGTSVAIKKLWPDRSREDMQISTHRLLHHHNIVELLYYYVCVHPTQKTIVWTLLLEPMRTTMLHEQTRLSDQGRLMRMTYIKVFMYQTLSGLAYMERKNVLHRDIKPENLLVDMDTGKLKIGDFGSSKHYRCGMPSSPYQVTRYYRAPELCLKYRFYGPTVDVWAAGCILCQLVTNRTVFYGRDNDDQLMKIIAICGTPNREQLENCVPGVQVNPVIFRLRYPPANWYRILHRYNERVTQECAEFVTKILRYESNLRLRGEKALKHPFFDTLREPGRILPNGRPLPLLSL